MNWRQENRSKLSFDLSFTARIITKYSLERFLSICGQKMSKGFLKFCKLISNLILGQIIVSNLTNVQKLNSRINNARLHKLDIKTNTKYNNYPGLPFEMQLLKVLSKASIASDFSTLFTHQARWKKKTVPSDIGFLRFRLWQVTYFSTKNPINKLAMNNRRLLIAAENTES